MSYRNIFIEFLYEYREYCPNSVQLVILDQNKNEDLINYFYEIEDIHVFQSKGTQVFYKKRKLSDIENTVVELAMINDTPQVYNLEEINNLIDVFNNESLEKNVSQFVYVKPVIQEMNMKAVFIVYSDVQIEWMITDKKLVKLCDTLQSALSDSIYNDINLESKSCYWLLKNDKYYISLELAKLLNVSNVSSQKDLEGFGLKTIENKEYLNSSLVSFEINPLAKVQSVFELQKLSIKEYSLLYIESNDNEYFDSLFERIVQQLNLIDGKLGKYNLFQVDNEHIVILYEEVHSKKLLEEHFKEFKYILVRSGNELKSRVDFKLLIDYLNLSPIEDFNEEYYKFYCDNYVKEQVKTVVQKTSKSKIKIIPIFDSLNSNKQGYLIKDTGDISLFDKNTKQKSLLSILKVCEDYKNDQVFLEIPLAYLFEGKKLSLSLLNKIHKYVDDNKGRCSIITNYSALLNKIYSHWPEFNKYLYFYDIPENLYQSLLSVKESNGLYINSKEYREFFNTNNITANKFIKFVLEESKKILINVKSNDIIKYQEDNLLLVCE